LNPSLQVLGLLSAHSPPKSVVHDLAAKVPVQHTLLTSPGHALEKKELEQVFLVRSAHCPPNSAVHDCQQLVTWA
jgi:hypothetical protein